MTWFLAAAGDAGEPWWIAAIKAFIVINLVLFGFAYLTLVERKVMGRMQLRYGPNRAGPFGLLQPTTSSTSLVSSLVRSRSAPSAEAASASAVTSCSEPSDLPRPRGVRT
jgi:NADH:ubiquinone oxidoreductase subunit H